MRESYSEVGEGAESRGVPDAPHREGITSVAEPSPAEAEVRELLARLLPEADVALLVRALRDEAVRAPADAVRLASMPAAHLSPAERELRRVRAQLALGSAASTLQHALNNPLTALLAEAQLLELEPLEGESLQAVSRIVELARRVISLVRRLEVGER